MSSGHGAPKPPVTCECGKVVSYYHLKVHQRTACLAKGTAKPPRPCGCGCGTLVESSAGRVKNFVDTHHYDKWRNSDPESRPSLYEVQGKSVEQRQTEEMKPVRMSEAEVLAEAERLGAVIISNREASYSRWMELLADGQPAVQEEKT